MWYRRLGANLDRIQELVKQVPPLDIVICTDSLEVPEGISLSSEHLIKGPNFWWGVSSPMISFRDFKAIRMTMNLTLCLRI